MNSITMNFSVLCNFFGAGYLFAPKSVAEESAVLVILAASLLVFRTFRERYLLLWIVGWLAYFVSRVTLHSFSPLPSFVVAVSQAEFMLAVCVFAAAVLVYTHARHMLLPLFAITASVMTFAVLRVLWWPDSITLRVALEVAYRFIAVAAAFQVIRFRWARWEIGPWLLGASLLFLHLNEGPVELHWSPLNFSFPPDSDLILDVIFGLSLLLVVFDDSRMRTRRLGVLNSLTTTIARAQQHGPMMATALEELRSLTGANAAWFRLLDGDKLILAQQIGLTADFVRDRNAVPLDEGLRTLLEGGEPVVIKTAA
ncbi:MAG: multi-sensor hybrid histidine kinase, partial [Acidobacteriaceae bacterium]|nr:multi-sensor hybrid histidine kinase [Acidobacteriaceae bacterium]